MLENITEFIKSIADVLSTGVTGLWDAVKGLLSGAA